MRIISKFHDYYDSLQTKDDLIYLREDKEIFTQDKFPYSLEHNIKLVEYGGEITKLITDQIIGFCDKWYIYYPIYDKHKDRRTYSIKYHICSLDDYLNNLKSKIDKRDKKFKYSYGAGKIYNVLTEIRNEYKNIFIDYQVPYFKIIKNVYSNISILTNFDNLYDVHFQKIMDVNTTFQELEMFIGNFLTKEKDITQITDSKILLESKGFDNKTSFRHPIK